MSRRLAAILVVLALSAAGILPCAARAIAQPGPSTQVVINGTPYASWSEYFRSDAFRANGLRCGTRAPWERSDTYLQDATPGDCTLDLTNPSGDYDPTTLLEITVVVHRLESTTGQGVFDDALVQSQIDVLNEDFRALPGTPGEPGTDTRIRFKLATEDPNGNPSPGWTRTLNEFWFNDLPDPLNGNYWDVLAWDPTRYLNIYTMSPVAPGGVVLGYVPYFPQEGAGGADDGVRCLWNSFGRNSGNPPYDGGRTVSHEVGHYLGLYHTFQDGCGTTEQPGCYSTGDRVCDTEPDGESHGGCPENSMSCGLPDPIRNYMEYTDDACMTNFTPEQARRMRCSMQHYRPNGYTTVVVGVDRPLAAGPAGRLEQNQPNPFAATTEFSFEIPKGGEASLRVIDVSGRVVRTLAAGDHSEGWHRLRWNGTDDAGNAVAPGVYFYQLRTSTGAQTRRMVMLQ